MIKAVFVDFYGTLVRENGPIVGEVLADICAAGEEKDPAPVFGFWWKRFGALLKEANEGAFRSQYALARQAFEETTARFASAADPEALCARRVEHWSRPSPFSDALPFWQSLRQPCYIVTNSDSSFLDAAVGTLGLTPAGMVTSERAGAYKPDRRVFETALRLAGLSAGEVVHIGDSLINDAAAASAVGIPALWLNREEKSVPDGVTAVCDLREAGRWIRARG